MSADFSIRPVGAPVPAPVVRIEPDAARAAVPTDLPSPKATTAAEQVIPVRNDVPDDLAHDIIIDRAAASVVYRVVNSLTGIVVQQFPDEAMLRSRAYARAIEEAKLTHTPVKYNQTV